MENIFGRRKHGAHQKKNRKRKVRHGDLEGRVEGGKKSVKEGKFHW